MLKVRKYFTLLEVLIAMSIIIVALPMLFTPFIYASIDQKETLQKLRQEKMAPFILVTILGELHTGAMPLTQLENGEAYSFKPDWKIEGTNGFPVTGTYKFKKIKEKDESKHEVIELWQTTFQIQDPVDKKGKSSSFSYQFIVKKAKPLNKQVEEPHES